MPTTLAIIPPEPAEEVALATTAGTVVVATEGTVVAAEPLSRLLRRPIDPVNSPCETVSDRVPAAPTVRAPAVPVVTGADVTRVLGSTEIAVALPGMFVMARVVGRMSVALATRLETTAVGFCVTLGTVRTTVTVPGAADEVAGRSDEMLGMMLSTVGTTDWMVVGTVALGRTEVRPSTWLRMLETAEVGTSEVTMELTPDATLGSTEVRPPTWLRMLETAEVGISEVTMELTPDTTLGSTVLRTEVTMGRTEVSGSSTGVVAALMLVIEATALDTTELAAETMELMSDVAIGTTESVGSVGKMLTEVLIEVGSADWAAAELATETTDETADEISEEISEETAETTDEIGKLTEADTDAEADADTDADKTTEVP